MMLLLKSHLVKLVRAGKKRQTVRLWTRPMVRAGQIVHTPGLGKLKILSIDELPTLGDLSEADAVADGFATLAELLAEIEKIYGNAPPAQSGRHIYRIRFEWPLDEAGAAPVLPGKSLVTAADAPVAARKAKPPSTPTPIPAPAISRSKTPAMTSAQRDALRSFVIARKPAR